MTVTELTPLRYTRSKNKYRVRFDNETDFVLYKKEINRFGIEPGAEISDEAYSDIMENILIPRAKQRALYLLEKMDRTEKNLRDKLKEGGYPDSVIDIAISYVSGYHYIDDLRYAKSYILSNQNTKSKRRIINDLKAKGIEKSICEKAVFCLEEDEEEVFKDEKIVADYIAKKSLNADLSDKKNANKIYNHLLRAGFSSEMILSNLRKFD